MSTSPSSKPTTKRKRTKESERDGEASAIVRSDKVWFEDGNVILQSGRMQFRIHKSVISRHSKVFRDMFEVPQPEGEPTTDGCQVALVMDEANDWENVLLVLYDGVKAYNPSDPLSLPLLGSMLRLGKKYEIDHLWDSAIERLEVDLPRSLEMWDKGYSKHLPRKAGDGYHMFDLINFLSDVGIQSLLPVAYLICIAVYEMKEIMWGSERDDGTSVHLTRRAQKALSVGKDTLMREIRHFPVDWLEDDYVDCDTREACNRDRAIALRLVIKYWPELMLLLDPEGYSALYNAHGYFICGDCKKEIRKKVKTSRQHIWDNLPEYFDLQSWEYLRKYRWQ